MKTFELIRKLQKLDPELEIIMCDKGIMRSIDTATMETVDHSWIHPGESAGNLRNVIILRTNKNW